MSISGTTLRVTTGIEMSLEELMELLGSDKKTKDRLKALEKAKKDADVATKAAEKAKAEQLQKFLDLEAAEKKYDAKVKAADTRLDNKKRDVEQHRDQTLAHIEQREKNVLAREEAVAALEKQNAESVQDIERREQNLKEFFAREQQKLEAERISVQRARQLAENIDTKAKEMIAEAEDRMNRMKALIS